jgi:nitrous oxide reductase accessory protein NosL
MMKRLVLAALIAGLLVLAGCGIQSDVTPTPEPETDFIPVVSVTGNCSRHSGPRSVPKSEGGLQRYWWSQTHESRQTMLWCGWTQQTWNCRYTSHNKR